MKYEFRVSLLSQSRPRKQGLKQWAWTNRSFQNLRAASPFLWHQLAAAAGSSLARPVVIGPQMRQLATLCASSARSTANEAKPNVGPSCAPPPCRISTWQPGPPSAFQHSLEGGGHLCPSLVARPSSLIWAYRGSASSALVFLACVTQGLVFSLKKCLLWPLVLSFPCILSSNWSL